MKETFEKRLERRMKNWKQEQHEKKVFGDPETEADYTDTYWKREFYHLDSTKEEVEWKIVKTESGGFIRRPFPVVK
tara:strand:- start:654 stop:881 length:228 start_codon:yes stop_codon:yes gene_type:complete